MSVDGYLQFSINDIDGYRLTFAEVQNEIAEPDPEFDAIVLDMDELASERSTFVPDSFSDNRFTDGPYTH